MTTIEYVTLEVADPTAAHRFYTTAFGLGDRVRTRVSQEAPTTGFRGFTLSLVVSQPATVDALISAALETGATVRKPAKKSLWGYGGAVEAPDGTILTLASSTKKNTGPATRQIDEVVLQLGVDDVGMSKRFYVDRGLTVAKSYGGRYVQFDSGPITLALYKRRALAKLVDAATDGSGSHRIAVNSEIGSFTDPDGFAWEPDTPAEPR